MNNIALIFAALMMILNFCGMAMADELPQETLSVIEESLSPIPVEEILPTSQPAELPDVEAEIPAQSSIFDIMVILITN